MAEDLSSIEKLLRYLQSLTPKDRSSVMDHAFILVAGMGLISQTILGENSAKIEEQMGYWFAPYVLYGITFAAIIGSWGLCNFLVIKHIDK